MEKIGWTTILEWWAEMRIYKPIFSDGIEGIIMINFIPFVEIDDPKTWLR